MDRLADSSGPDGSYEYDYDLNGNRNWHKRNTVQTSYTYNAARTRLQALSGGVNETRLYDDSGNTTQIDGRDFDHNEQNRLWRYQEGSVSIEYRHNAFGERQVKDDGATITRFVYDGPRLMHERTGASPRDYIYLEGQLVGLVQNGSLYFVHTDHLGRPEIVTNGAKSVRWSAQNNAFGNIPATDLIGGLHIAFPGQYYDIESGTYYNYFRTYDATVGRYLQSDPIGLAGGLNTYAYVGGNPLSYVDPYGLLWLPGDPLPEGVVDSCTAIGDFATLGATRISRKWLGISSGDSRSSVYQETTRVLAIGEIAMGPIGILRAAGRRGAREFTEEIGDTLVPKGSVSPYEVGRANDLRARSAVGDELDVHHAGQAHAMEQLVPGYGRATGPAITVPRAEHVQIPTVRGPVSGSARDQLAKDIRDLRNHTNAPNSSLQELIEFNRKEFPGAFQK